MKKLIFILTLALSVSKLFAWGAGHDVQVNLTMKYVGEDIAKFFSDAKANPQKWCHFPDGHKTMASQKNVVKALGEKEAKLLDERLKSQYFFHSARGKCIAYTQLIKAFRENNPQAAAFYAGAFMHAVADSSAFNHGPLIHTLTYFNYKHPSAPKAELDLVIYNKSPEIQKRTAELLADFKPDNSPKKLEDMFVKIFLISYEDAAFMASVENGLVAPAPKGKLSKQAEEVWAKTADRQVREAVNFLRAAWNIAKTDQDLNPENIEFFNNPKAKIKRPIQNKAQAEIKKFMDEKQLLNDSVYAGLLGEPKKFPAVALIAEPSNEMGIAKMGFESRAHTAMCARTLNNANVPTKLFDMRKLEKNFVDAKKYPLLIVNTTAHIPNKKGLDKYIKDGGKLLVIGGRSLGGTPLSKFAKNRPNNEVPTSTKYGVSNVEEIKNMSLEFTPALKKAVKNNKVKFSRNPNTPAGWGKAISLLEFEGERIVPLAYLHYGTEGKKYCCAAAFKNEGGKIFAAYLPKYLISPLLFADDSEKMSDWSVPSLDSFGSPILVETVKLLSR